MDIIEKINAAPAGSACAEEIVRQLRLELHAHKGQWARLARISKGKLTYTWIKLFAAGEIDNPGVENALNLAKYLGVVIKAEPGPHFNRFGA